MPLPANHSRLEPAPVVIDLDRGPGPRAAARALADLPYLLLLESTMAHDTLGRYSFLLADPVAWFQPDRSDAATALHWLDRQLAGYATIPHPHLPPFQGGVAGLLAYEFNAALEPVLSGPPHGLPPAAVPPVSLGVYDIVVAWDHLLDRCHIISQGFPDTGPQRLVRATERADQLADRLRRGARGHDPGESLPRLDRTQLTSNFSRQQYLSTITRALDYIHAGDVFQVNIAQQLSYPAVGQPLDLYEHLATCNPAPFSGYFDIGQAQIISASPERLIAVREGHAETRPIKGTRRRTRHPEVDLAVANQLKRSHKDRAENVMITDLMRNDLSRFCTADSVRVSQFVELESYASVLHLVSAVEGQIREATTASDVLRAVFPGGSITGAPKVRAMEIIAELEGVPRGAYCGSLGYFGFDGSIDLNILIRTITAADGKWQVPVGGSTLR